MTASLEKYFTNNFTTTENELAEVVSKFNHKKAIKDEILLASGEVCKNFYFIINGCLKAYFIDTNGQETIRFVAFENQFISTIHSFIEQSPSNEYICALESSELLVLPYSDFRSTLNQVPFFKDFYIWLLERTYVNNHWRIETFLRLNAKQRYNYLLENNKQLVQRLSNKDLSAFLGITQESLSRIKAQK